LHDLGIHLSNNTITVLEAILGSIIGLKRGKIGDILVKVACKGDTDDRVDDGWPTGLVLAETLVRRNKFLQLLQSLVKTSVLSGRSQVGDGTSRVGTSLRDGSFRGVVGGVEVGRWKRVDEAVRVVGDESTRSNTQPILTMANSRYGSGPHRRFHGKPRTSTKSLATR
jgi:hypothetical protein